MTGTNKRGIEQIGLDVLEDLILGGILGGIGSKIKIKGLNAGRNNYQAIFAGGITRLINGTGAMHLKTLLKGYIAQLVESIGDGVAGDAIALEIRETISGHVLTSDLEVLILAQEGSNFYNKQIVKAPQGKCARQIGNYKYQEYGNTKVIPIIAFK